MQNVQATIAPIACTLSDLTAFTQPATKIETVFAQDEAFGIKLTVAFEGGGAIALMPLALSIVVDFYAKPCGLGDGITLGTITTTTIARQLTYPVILSVPKGPASLAMVADRIYNISALLRVGSQENPAFIYGVIENLMIQIYNSTEK